ncbi:hypothetical protein IWQ61_002992 [Dispira simplex]|nr:hypothetical protein IWQ61_002992 [Dispira simplex]
MARSQETDITHPPTQQTLVLKEYKQLVKHIHNINEQLTSLNNTRVPQLTDTLRTIERQSALVFTLIQSSVYALIAEQDDPVEDGSSLKPTESWQSTPSTVLHSETGSYGGDYSEQPLVLANPTSDYGDPCKGYDDDTFTSSMEHTSTYHAKPYETTAQPAPQSQIRRPQSHIPTLSSSMARSNPPPSTVRFKLGSQRASRRKDGPTAGGTNCPPFR